MIKRERETDRRTGRKSVKQKEEEKKRKKKREHATYRGREGKSARRVRVRL